MTVGGGGGDGLICVHVSKFGTSIIFGDTTIGNGGGDITCNGFCRINTTRKEILDVGGIDKPRDITFDKLHSSPGNLSKTTAIYITFSVFSIGRTSRTIDARKIEILIITTGHIDRHIMGFRIFISVAPIG